MREASPASWVDVPRFPLYGVALDVRSLYNVGALFRASDAARVAHLYLLGGSGHPGRERARIEKTGLGTPETVPWTWAPRAEPVLDALQGRGVRLVALELSPGSRRLEEVDPAWFPLALIVGHETDGVPESVLRRCDDVLAIDTWGRKPSLNVALAYGVATLALARVWAGQG
jgi:tRNA G18 (ribose-2'-O)-methylase SpoU